MKNILYLLAFNKSFKRSLVKSNSFQNIGGGLISKGGGGGGGYNRIYFLFTGRWVNNWGSLWLDLGRLISGSFSIPQSLTTLLEHHNLVPTLVTFAEQAMAQWWESWRHMWVEFVVGFPPLLQEVFLQVLLFSPLFKNQHFQIPVWPGIS